MTRLIDADALKLSHCKECTLYPNNCLGENCDWDSIAHINMMPTVDAEPVRHGHWTVTRWFVQCSECGEAFPLTPTNYCPNCGAKMDERKEK